MKSHAVFALSLGLAMAMSSNRANAKDKEKNSSHNYTTTDIEFKAHDKVAMLGRLVLPQSNSPRAIVIAVQTAEGATVDMKRPLVGGKTFNYFDLYRKHLTPRNIGFFSYEGRGIRMGPSPSSVMEVLLRSRTSSFLRPAKLLISSSVRFVFASRNSRRFGNFSMDATNAGVSSAFVKSKTSKLQSDPKLLQISLFVSAPCTRRPVKL